MTKFVLALLFFAPSILSAQIRVYNDGDDDAHLYVVSALSVGSPAGNKAPDYTLPSGDYFYLPAGSIAVGSDLELKDSIGVPHLFTYVEGLRISVVKKFQEFDGSRFHYELEIFRPSQNGLSPWSEPMLVGALVFFVILAAVFLAVSWNR